MWILYALKARSPLWLSAYTRSSGGKITVQHAAQRIKYDWAAKSNFAIFWAAFY
ncbi:hypothetical protein BDW66DRAFT_133577 [Aspergillus desertorum]